MIELIEAANNLARLLEADTRPFLQIHRDANLKGAIRRIVAVTRKRFRSQRAAVLAKASALRPFAARESEADDKLQRDLIIARAQAALGPLIRDVHLSTADTETFDGAVGYGVESGADGVRQLLQAERMDSESFIARYLKDNGFTKLTGELDNTTVDRLASAVADAYESGEDFDGVVKAIKSEFADFASSRAKMIAQTEINGAYNQGVLSFGREAGATKKSWQVDLAPCPICIENELAGQIDLDDLFPSGDYAPTAHPRCECSLLVHA